MRLREYLEKRPKKQIRAKAKSAPVALHSVFVPMIAVWGAALLGLATLVLPASLIAHMAVLSGAASLGSLAKFVFAGIAALLGGGLGFVVAAAIRESAKQEMDRVPVVSAVKSRRVRPIDPASELGSESLDAPIEDMPFSIEEYGDAAGEDEELLLIEAAEEDQPGQPDATPKQSKPQLTLGELAKRGYEIEESADLSEDAAPPSFTRRHFKEALIESCEGATCEAAPADSADPKPAAPLIVTPKAKGVDGTKRQPLGRPGSNGSWSLTEFNPSSGAAPSPAEPKPRALELEEFAELPGRSAVWVEEDGNGSHAASTRANPPLSALEKLRQKPPEELSLVEMVERFAGALHQHQQSERAKLASPNTPKRDTALAEALKALTLFTERGFDERGADPSSSDNASTLSDTERELRIALAKLQTLRGAA